MNFSKFADIITVISGIITILGIGGVLSWRFFSHMKNPLSDKILSIFSYSIKTSIIIILICPVYYIWEPLYESILVFLKDSLDYKYLYWDSSSPFKYIISYFLSLGIILPLYIIIIVSIYRMSISPIKKFIYIFFRKNKP